MYYVLSTHNFWKFSEPTNLLKNPQSSLRTKELALAFNDYLGYNEIELEEIGQTTFSHIWRYKDVTAGTIQGRQAFRRS